LIGVVFAFFLASEVDVVAAGTLIEAEAVHHIAFRLAEVVLIFRVVYTFVFFRFSEETFHSSSFYLLIELFIFHYLSLQFFVSPRYRPLLT
jgi:hypothetical protein